MRQRLDRTLVDIDDAPTANNKTSTANRRPLLYACVREGHSLGEPFVARVLRNGTLHVPICNEEIDPLNKFQIGLMANVQGRGGWCRQARSQHHDYRVRSAR